MGGDTTIGVDTGATGAIAIGTCALDLVVFDLKPEPITIGQKPRNVVDVAALLDVLRPRLRGRAVAFLEAPVLQPKNGTINAAQAGATLGSIRAALIALGVRVEIVEPQIWYQHHGLTGTSARGKVSAEEGKRRKLAAKLANVARAVTLFPRLARELHPPVEPRLTKSGALHKTQPKGGPDFDRADAVLIWAFGHRTLGR